MTIYINKHINKLLCTRIPRTVNSHSGLKKFTVFTATFLIIVITNPVNGHTPIRKVV